MTWYCFHWWILRLSCNPKNCHDSLTQCGLRDASASKNISAHSSSVQGFYSFHLCDILSSKVSKIYPKFDPQNVYVVIFSMNTLILLDKQRLTSLHTSCHYNCIPEFWLYISVFLYLQILFGFHVHVHTQSTSLCVAHRTSNFSPFNSKLSTTSKGRVFSKAHLIKITKFILLRTKTISFCRNCSLTRIFVIFGGIRNSFILL